MTTRIDDSATGTSRLHPQLTLLDASNTPVLDSPVRAVKCAVPNACNSSCPLFKRTLPFDGTFRLAVQGLSDGSCTGGKYKLVLISPGGAALTRVSNDVDPF